MKPQSLNKAQRQAVDIRTGPLLVLAGAGTGKTRVVTYRIANLIRHGVAADRILAVTFTKKAAREMQQRVSQLLPRRKTAGPLLCTFHSLCVRILRRHITHLGFPSKFVILDRGDQESQARMALRETRIADHQLAPTDLLWFISRWKSRGMLPADVAATIESDREQLAAVCYRRYMESLRQAGALDFDDLLLCTERLFREHPAALAEEAGRWDHLLIDEYQDTNGEQYKIIRQLASRHANLCVVGDDDQSIYGWRGAQVQNILRFRDDWPQAQCVRLDENYRSTAEILQMANRLIEHNRARHEKSLRAVRSGGPAPRVWQANDETQEASEIVRQIRALLQRSEVQASDIAILFRTNEQPRPFETELRKAKLPYVLVGGVSFFDRKEVKDLLAYFRLLDNPQDELAARRLINIPPRGMGKSAVERLVETSIQQTKQFGDVLRNPPADLPAAARQGVAQFVQLIDEGHRTLTTQSDLVAWARQQIDRLTYRREVDRLYADPDDRESRWAAVEAVVNALAQFVSEEKGRPRLSDFLDQMAIGDREIDSEKERQLARNAIMLMTMHSAKGLEFPYVFIVGLEEGILPHHRSIADGDAAIEEERRLCYVGVTRAQEQLTLSMALTRLKWGKPRDSVPSRFLYELTGQTSNPKYEIARSGKPPPSEGPTKRSSKQTTPHGRVQRASSALGQKKSSPRRTGR